MTYFKDIYCIEDLKEQYRALALQHHPDAGGTEEAMKAINLEYEGYYATYQNIHRNLQGETYEDKKAQTGYDGSGYREIIDKLAGIAAAGYINMELCGNWIWITGETRKYKDIIKETGAKWSPKKNAWYWHEAGYKKRGKKSFSLDDIRELWGTQTIRPGAATVAIPF